jgi:chromosome partitioning protein
MEESMPVIVVANPKGGVGKSTLSTNIAGYYASRGMSVMLGDVDRQQSARTWLALRPPGLATISPWEVSHDAVVRPPKGTTHVVLDTPAGLHGKRLDEVMKLADKVLVPLQPSIFDIHATHAFVRQLLASKRSDRVQIAIVGMRTREGTIGTDQLRGFLDGLEVPLLGFVRDTQNYVHLAAHGLTLWDVSSNRFERDIEQWQPIIKWLDA